MCRGLYWTKYVPLRTKCVVMKILTVAVRAGRGVIKRSAVYKLSMVVLCHAPFNRQSQMRFFAMLRTVFMIQTNLPTFPLRLIAIQAMALFVATGCSETTIQTEFAPTVNASSIEEHPGSRCALPIEIDPAVAQQTLYGDLEAAGNIADSICAPDEVASHVYRVTVASSCPRIAVLCRAGIRATLVRHRFSKRLPAWFASGVANLSKNEV